MRHTAGEWVSEPATGEWVSEPATGEWVSEAYCRGVGECGILQGSG